jgi:hypothetical protein
MSSTKLGLPGVRVEAPRPGCGSWRLTVRTLPFCPGCPLARVNHALAMNEEEIENHFNEIHYELQAYKKQLDSKEDLK